MLGEGKVMWFKGGFGMVLKKLLGGKEQDAGRRGRSCGLRVVLVWF